ncbi:thioesterase family protein [Oligoflexus tunisiensis]|uniref:thioesterase family protein n=1 Tax=Oligoflexus tunisiensis TaxID=708132 RepID=UPI000AD42B02|nr:thioesterase family protein [Oligoflexus tunisiensis]
MAESGVIRGQVEFPVYYEDTDLSGFVYHSNYLKYFERAREHVIGIRFLKELFDQGMHFVVSKVVLEYKAPAQHGDQVLIVSEGQYSRSPAIPFEQNAYRVDAEGQKRLLVSGQVTIVALNAQNRPIRMPDVILERFQSHNRNAAGSEPTTDEESPPW